MTPSTSPAPVAPRRRPSRFWLYAPFVLLLLASTGWVGGWLWMRGEVFRRIDAGAMALGDSGYRVDWARRSLDGFPFRLDLTLNEARLREAGGWGLSAPVLKAEAFVFAPDHWVIVAPAGVTLQRRVGGPAVIGAKSLRASLSDLDAHPARLSVEGFGLTFAPGVGGAPVAFASAEELHIHAKAGPDNQGAAYFELDMARGPGLFGDIAAGAPVTLVADGIFSHADAASGPGWAGALRGWSAAGGQLTLRRLAVLAGTASADSGTGALRLAADGRLVGEASLKLKHGSRFLQAWSARHPIDPAALNAAEAILSAGERDGEAAVTAHFQAGQTTLGPVALGPSPRIY